VDILKAHVDGRTLAGQDADALLGVDLLFRVMSKILRPICVNLQSVCARLKMLMRKTSLKRMASPESFAVAAIV